VEFLISIINLAARAIIFLVIIQVLLSYFMDPYHPLRQTIDNILEPIYVPIRKFLPQTGMFDFSPIILIIVIQLLSWLLIRLLSAVY
jgi:YggT family protein